MKNRTLPVALASLALLTLNFQFTAARAQGTTFTYQGRLNDGGAPANGTNYGMLFHLYDAATNGNSLGNLGIVSVTVSNGLFTVPLDFGGSVFDGNPRWLDISVQKNGGSFTTLSPRQSVTPTPYAIFAENVGIGGLAAGTYGSAVIFSNASNSFSGSFTGNGTGVTNVNAATLGGLGANQFWKTTGNNNTVAGVNFLGTTDNQPLEFWVNQARSLRLEPGTNVYSAVGAPNVIGGAPNNFVDGGVVGATIAGGGAVNMTGYLAGPSSNHVAAIFGSIGGGRLNTVGADHGVIGGGIANTVQSSAFDAVIGGGQANTIQTNAYDSVIGGGFGNTIQHDLTYATISGGQGNAIGAGDNYTTIGGGGLNTIQTNARSSTINGGSQNTISSDAIRSTIAGGINQFIGTNAHHSTISGGEANAIQTNSDHATISGGYWNTNSQQYATISGGYQNTIYNNGPNVAGTIAGGYQNTMRGSGTIGGGAHNSIGLGPSSTIAGGFVNITGDNTYDSTISGGSFQTIGSSVFYATIAGGRQNTIGANTTSGTIGGGMINAVSGNYATIPGGASNSASGISSFAAGNRARANHDGAFVWADSQSADFASSGSNQFLIRAAGGVGVNTTNPAGAALNVAGAVRATTFQGDGSGLVNLPGSGNYVFAYAFNIQSVTTPNTFQDVTFGFDAQTNGWTHFAGSAPYICNRTGLYLVQYTAEANVADTVTLRGTLNLVEIPGSEAYSNPLNFGATVPISKSFLAGVNAGDFLTLQFTGASINDRLQGGGSSAIQPCASLIITRIQ